MKPTKVHRLLSAWNKSWNSKPYCQVWSHKVSECPNFMLCQCHSVLRDNKKWLLHYLRAGGSTRVVSKWRIKCQGLEWLHRGRTMWVKLFTWFCTFENVLFAFLFEIFAEIFPQSLFPSESELNLQLVFEQERLLSHHRWLIIFYNCCKFAWLQTQLSSFIKEKFYWNLGSAFVFHIFTTFKVVTNIENKNYQIS